MYTVYVLLSLKDNKHYIGSTGNLEKRLNYHFKGCSKATKNRLPLKLIYTEQFDTKRAALLREFKLKSYKSSKYIKLLIENKK